MEDYKILLKDFFSKRENSSKSDKEEDDE